MITLAFAFAQAALAQPFSSPTATEPQPATELPAQILSVSRAPQPSATLPLRVDTFSRSDLLSPTQLTLDDALRRSAAFSLFRRSGSLTAHPTAQGVSLRGLGPSGASRTLVLLDGVPLNDPFGGWVAWTKLPRFSLAGAEIVRGGGSGAWGNAALGGTVQLFTQPLAATPTSNGTASVMLGERGTREGGFAATLPLAGPALRIEARAFTTDGWPSVAPDFRGPIDQPAASDHHAVHATYRQPLAAGTRELIVNARHYDEDRNNGTPGQRNQSRETFVSATFASTPLAPDAAPAWSVTGYAQDQSFASSFTAVADDRASESPALDQYDVPARAAGAAGTTTWTHASGASTTTGADVRWVEGETREAYFFVNDAPTRRRTAGGEQTFAGVFVAHDRPIAEALHVSLSARLDHWRNATGHRRETDTTTGAVLRDDTFAATSGTEFSPRLGLTWQTTSTLRLRAAAYHAFRVPTLNEFHRPFRVGNVITEANPTLAVETLTGAETGLDFATPDGRATFAFTGFVNELDDAVANITLGHGPGNVPGVGFVPAGGTGRQRRNVPALRVRGLELTARVSLHPTLQLRADYLLSDARVTTAPAEAPTLAGRRLPQVPRHTVTAGLRWTPRPAWTVALDARHTSAAFEDDENQLALAAATTTDFAVTHRFSPRTKIFAAVQNLFNATVETGRSADGLINVAPSRAARAGLRYTW